VTTDEEVIIGVIGAGAMGRGIAQVAASAGHHIVLGDAQAGAVERALETIRSSLAREVAKGKLAASAADDTLERISDGDDVAGGLRAYAPCDVVIEAVVEDLAAKQALFHRLDALVPDSAILATNTSSLSIARIAASARKASRVIGMHFFNPVHIMKLVEIVTHTGCDDETVASARRAAERMGKTTILVRDIPGFASSRLGVVLGLEAMRMLEDGVASAADIDTAMELGYGHPMGPLRLSDLVGLDVRLKIAEYLHRELGDMKFAPPRILREKVQRGELGKKTRKGFYEW